MEIEDTELNDKWLRKVKHKLKKYTNSYYWDKIKLSETLNMFIQSIQNCESVKDLPERINARIIQSMFIVLDSKINFEKNKSVSNEIN